MNAADSSESFSRQRHDLHPLTNLQAHGYREKIQRMLKTNSLRLTVNINHLRIFNREYAQGLLSSPVDYLPACDKALNDTLHTLDPEYALASIGLDGSFGLNAVCDLHPSHVTG
jgi:DNA replicative helicase MCM subunit Mcm2 (Cdc46/Mcm family)